MGCFCRNLIPRPEPSAQPDPSQAEPKAFPLLEAVSDHLSARWQPAEPWNPDPAWLDIPWPAVPLPAASLGVLVNLFGALEFIRVTLGLDLQDPVRPRQLARVVATLNARTPLLAELEEDRRPFTSLLPLMHHVDVVERAVRQKLLDPPVRDDAPPDTRVWKPVLLRVKALAPLVVIGQQLKLDWTDPDAALARVTDVLRVLARVELPPLQDPELVLRLVGRLDAAARLKDWLGADPTPHPFARVRAALERRAEAAERLLPQRARLEHGALVGMPPVDVNMGPILNPATVAQARLITPRLLERLNWKVPDFSALPLLTVAMPVTHLVAAMARLNENPVRSTPCDRSCDAARVMRAPPTAPGSPVAVPTARPGSGTGAAPAG